MDSEERYALITRNVEELVTEEELKALLVKPGYQPTAYIGFEPSGLVHLGWALVAAKIRDLCAAGVKVTIFWADWHAYINDKLGGDLENIRTCARYMEDCFKALGVPEDKVEFKYATDLLDGIDYWETVIKVAKVTSLSRVKRAMTIMGRSEDEAEVDSSKLFYPILQASDIFFLNVDISYAGMDQRRANMLARDAADKLGWKKPIALHTPLLPGLEGGDRMDPAASKMSKSKPDSSVKIHDPPSEVKRKMSKAFCPPGKEDEDINPVLMICKSIIFPQIGRMDIERPEKFGGNVTFNSYPELTDAYFGGKLHPMDLKNGAAAGLSKCLEPVQKYFEIHPENLTAMHAVLKKLGKE
jgi:tyrosyl-tRNA synthetase